MHHHRKAIKKNTIIKIITLLFFSFISISCSSLRFSGSFSSSSPNLSTGRNTIKIQKNTYFRDIPVILSYQIVNEIHNLDKPETVLNSVEIFFW